MKTKLVILFIAIMSISCESKEKKKLDISNFQSKKTENLTPNKDSILLTKDRVDKNKVTSKLIIGSTTITPDYMVGSGCGCSFYFNETDFKEQKFFWLDNSTEGIIYINGKLEKLSFKKESNSVFEYVNSNYNVNYKILESTPIDVESAKIKGTLRIIKVNNTDSIEIKFIGFSGC